MPVKKLLLEKLTAPLKTSVKYVAACRIYSTSPMACPLCGVQVPAKKVHECVQERRG